MSSIHDLSSPTEIRDILDKAFDYRGDVSLTLKSGDKIEGYVFDRRSEGPGLEQCFVRLFPTNCIEKISLRYSDIAAVEFSGRDMAAGRNFDLWLKKYREKKARGEKGIRLEPEPLD